jgi:TPR repeat protein
MDTDSLLKQAEKYTFGRNGVEQDFEKARKLHIKAIKEENSIISYRRLGIFYKEGKGVGIDVKKAFKFFKEGAYKGDFLCFAILADMFQKSGNFKEAMESWDKYFEFEKSIEPLYAMAYMTFIFNNKLSNMKYIDKLLLMKEDIKKALKDVGLANDELIDNILDYYSEITK